MLNNRLHLLRHKIKVLAFFCVLTFSICSLGEDGLTSKVTDFEKQINDAQSGIADAQFNLGVMHANGQGVAQDDKKAFEWYTKAAEQGHMTAQYNLGVMHSNGQGVAQDDEKAFEWYTKAARQEDSMAQNNLGFVYEHGRGVLQDDKAAFLWYTKAAEQGYSLAQSNLALAYENGRGVSQNTKLAFIWYQRAAEQGDKRAEQVTGHAYYWGNGVAENKATGVGWLLKAAEQGDVLSQSTLGFAYYWGEGVKQDYVAAVKWDSKAAVTGNSDSQNRLGLSYNHGEGVARDYETAVEWHKKAAEQGHMTAQFNLGLSYKLGEGVAQDYETAVEWYKKSAAQGYNGAQFYLGLAYSFGEGIDQNHETAIEWYTKAAEQGHMTAQYNLGVAYTNGQGVAQDDKKAFEWYTKASKQGHANAQNNLALLYDLGEGVEKDHQKAHELFSKAASIGSPTAELNLGLNYSFGERKNIPSSLEMFKRAFDNGKLSAGFRVALQYLDKESGFYYPEAAFNTLQKIVDNGDTNASYFSNSLALLAHMYATGLHVPKNISKARDLLGRLIPKDIDPSVFAVLVPTLNTVLTASLSEKYVSHLMEALADTCISELDDSYIQDFTANPVWKVLQSITFTDDNLAAACFELHIKDQIESGNYFIVAERYQVGVPGLIEVDKEKAFKYMLMAAESNSSADNAIAMDWTAIFYGTGYGTVKNPAAALFWHQKAAELGFAQALNNLGWAYEKGDLELEIDLKKAFDYYNRAYMKGVDCNLCMTNLGRMYESGKAVNQDLSMAKILYTKSFDLGDLEAGNLLASLEREGLAGPKNEVSAIATLERVVLGNPTYKLSVGEASHDDEVNKARAQLEALGLINKPESTLNLGDYYALVIGNSTAENDATEVAHVLENEYGFSVTLLLDANRNEMIKALNRYQRDLKKSDNFLLYYAGHGSRDETKEGYWQPVDADEIDNAQWIPNTRINRTLKKFNANNILIIADSCYAASQLRGRKILPATLEDSGSSKNDGSTLLQRLNRSKSRVAMTSGGVEPVVDSVGFSQNSIFAESLIQTLKLNSQIILAEDVFKKVRERVVPITADAGHDQTPEYGQLYSSGHEGGDFIFKRVSL